jgi:cytochrome c biogenesis protein CcdA
MKTLWNDIKDIYGSAWAFALVCPILFMIPVLFEFAQHVVEVNAGMYLSKEDARAAADDSARMTGGFIKTIAISLPSYWFYRFVVSDRNASYARRIDPGAIELWGSIFLLFVVGFGWLSLFGPSLGQVLGLEGRAESMAKIMLALVQTFVGIYLTVWLVALSQGNAAVGPFQSARIVHGYFWHTVALMTAAIVPLMVLHYAALFAIGRPEPIVWTIMAFDSLVVGFLALTMHGANAVAARRAAAARRISLLPAHGGQEPAVETGAFAQG